MRSIESWRVSVLLVICFLVQNLPAAGYALSIRANKTDSSISNGKGEHYVDLNPWAIRRNILFLFFPGTGSSAQNFKKICHVASDQGFHAISLQYSNRTSVNFTCNRTNNLDCYENLRKEIIFGIDLSSHVEVDHANSIENRLIKLLVYLSEHYPLDGWEQFLTPETRPRWSNILLAGHSQGGGHAALIGKYYKSAGVLMFSSFDYNTRLNKPANWVNLKGGTDINRFFALAHSQDKTMPISVMRKFWNASGFRRKTPITIVSGRKPLDIPRILITSVQPARLDKAGSNYHNAVIMDADTPLLSDGSAQLAATWIYLMNSAVQQW